MAGQEDRRGVGQQVGQDVSEFDQLSAALQGFDPETGQSNSPNPAEPEYVLVNDGTVHDCVC